MKKYTKYLTLFAICLMAIFVIQSVQAQAPSIVLPNNQVVQEFVSDDQFTRQYQFSAMPDQSMFVLAVSKDYTDAPSVDITKQVTNDDVASLKMAVNGMCLRIAPGTTDYNLNITADYNDGQPSDTSQYYSLMVVPGDPSQMLCPTDALTKIMTATEGGTAATGLVVAGGITLPGGIDIGGTGTGGTGGTGNGGGNCSASSGVSVGVNIHAGADVTAPVVTTLSHAVAPVLGVLSSNNNMVLLDVNGKIGFASGNLLNLGGDCSNVTTVITQGNQVLGTGIPTNLSIDLAAETPVQDLNANVNTNGGLNVHADGTGLVNTNDNVNLNGNGLTVGVNANVPAIGTGADVNATLNNNGLNANANVNTPLDTNANANASLNNNGLNANVNANTPIGDANVSINTGNGSGSSGSGSGGSSGGSGICVNALGIKIGC